MAGNAEHGAWRRLGAWAAATLLPIALIVGACGGSHDTDDEEEDRPVSAPPRVSSGPAGIVVTLDAATLSRAGIAAEALGAATRAAGVNAYGRVLDLTDLAAQRGAFASARARVEKAHAALSASGAELERLQGLYAGDRNASQKALQAAAARAQTDQAEVKAAEEALEAQRDVARQRWGAVIAESIERGGPRLDALLQQKERLIEVVLPTASAPVAAGTPVTMQAASDRVIQGRVVSPAPRADPAVQGPAYFCTLPAVGELIPGMSVVAQVDAGPSESGVVVPTSAVVWWRGRAWAYVEKGGGTFIRTELATERPVPGGWFVSSGLAPGTRIVVRGAQVLLSEEGRGAVSGSEG